MGDDAWKPSDAHADRTTGAQPLFGPLPALRVSTYARIAVHGIVLPLSFLLTAMGDDGSSLAFALGVGTLFAVAALFFVEVASLPVWIRFQVRAATNLQLLGDPPNEKPWVGVLYWFVPIANLLMPYRVMRDLHQRSVGDPPANAGEDVFKWWWGCHLATNILSNVSFRMTMSGGTDLEAVSMGIDVLSYPLLVVSAWLYLRFAEQIAQAQKARLAAA